MLRSAYDQVAIIANRADALLPWTRKSKSGSIHNSVLAAAQLSKDAKYAAHYARSCLWQAGCASLGSARSRSAHGGGRCKLHRFLLKNELASGNLRRRSLTRINITDILSRLGVTHTLHQHPAVRNAGEAAAAGLTFELALLVKTLVFRTPEKWLLTVLRAQDRIAYSALAKAAGVERTRIRYATDEELQNQFGWEPGGAGPVTELDQVDLLVDEAVFRMPRIYFGGGTRTVTIETKPNELFGKIHHRRASLVK